MLALLHHLALFSHDVSTICQAAASVGNGAVSNVQQRSDRDREALARAAAWAEQVLASSFMPHCAWIGNSSSCALNTTWAQSMVTSRAAKRAVRQIVACTSHHSESGCSTDSFCEWADDVGRCDVEAEHVLGDTLMSIILQPTTRNTEAQAQKSESYTSVCGFGAELRAWYGECASTPLGSSCPSHCQPTEAQCLYRSGACHKIEGCELNATTFWRAVCGSDVGARCGVKMVSWSWAQIERNESWQQAVDCLQLSCPSAASYWRRVFFLRDHCASLNTSEGCIADRRCGNVNTTFSETPLCVPKPGEYAPRGCSFGEFADAAWECSRRNRSSCVGDCHYLAGGSCWLRHDRGRAAQTRQCFSTPSSKALLRESSRPNVCAMTSSYGLRTLAAVSKLPDLDMLARLTEHQAHCEKLELQDTCNQPPIVYGEVEMNVSDPQAFSEDQSAREAVAKAIAVLAHVAPGTVTVTLSVAHAIRRLAEMEESVSLEASAKARHRRASIALNRAGMVNADYTIYIPLAQDVENVVDSLQGVDNAAATAEVLKALDHSSVSRTYLVEVKHITASSDIGRPIASHSVGTRAPALLIAIYAAAWFIV